MKHQFSHLFLVVTASITVLVVAIVYVYMSHAVSTSAAQSSSARQAVAAAQTNKNREDAFMQVYQSTADSWAKLPTFFVSSNNVVSFIESVESIGTQTGATTSITTIDADNLDNAPPGKLGIIRAHVEGQGTWAQLMRCLELAEIMPYKVSINNVQFDTDTSNDKNSRHLWKLSFDIQASMISSAQPGQATSTSPKK